MRTRPVPSFSLVHSALPIFIAAMLLLVCGGGRGPFGPGPGLAAETRGIAILVIDPDPKGSNVREKPGGTITKVIPHEDQGEAARSMRRVTVLAQEKDWFQLRLGDGTYGWMHRKVLGARIGPGGDFALRTTPQDSAPILVTPKPGTLLKLLELYGDWVKMEYADSGGAKSVGWIKIESLASGPKAEDDNVVEPAMLAMILALENATGQNGSESKDKTLPPKEAPPAQRAPAQSKARPEKTKEAQQPQKDGKKTDGEKLALAAQKYLGVKYKWGGTTPAGFDCSGFVYYVYKEHGITIPRTSREQAKAGKAVAKKDVLPGDLVFFGPRASGPVDHVGIYIGSDTYVHAPNPSYPILKTRLSDNTCTYKGKSVHFVGEFVTARRFIGD
ncbi:NlpC/P60 family protein [Desulfovibrio sp. OttesenSCG-928-A18]|nr:NlpC/P60 family protein [Desulfovibrio sp. OttesenSCG-928-A18]